MPNVAPINDILTRIETALTQNWQRIDSNPSDRDGFFLFNASESNQAVYRLLEAGGSAPSGAGAVGDGSGVLDPLETRYIGAGNNVEVFAYAIAGTDDLVMEETS